MTGDAAYYRNVNQELLDRLPPGARRVLEIGCGSGALAQAYRARNPGAHYTGVERFEPAAREAAARCDAVVLGDVESPACLEALDRLHGDGPWELLVCGDVLEHLLDPLRVLAELRRRMRVDALCLACIPNVGHVSVVQGLLRARFDYADAGLLDRTHLRFFTQPSMATLFAQAGWQVEECTARVLDPEPTRRAIEPLLALAPALGLDPAQMQLHLSAYQWIVRARNPAAG